MVSPNHVMAVEWLMVILACVLVGLRAGVRVLLKQTHLIASDVLLLLGAACLLGLVVCDTITYRVGAMSDFEMISEELGKIRFATNYFFDVGLYLPKLSMLAIYFQLFPGHDRPLRMALYFVTAFTISAALVTIFSDTFWCGKDVSVNWSVGPDACSAFVSTTLMSTNWSLCITSEALLFLLPIPLLRHLSSLGRGQKAGLVVVFTLGLVTMIVSTGRFITMMCLGTDISLYIWATTEFSVAVMVVACVALRPLARKMWRSRVSGRGISLKTRTTGPSGLPPSSGSGTRKNLQRPVDVPVGAWNSSGSEIGLNDLQPAKSVKTICVSTSSERPSKDGTSSVAEDRTFNDLESHPNRFVNTL